MRMPAPIGYEGQEDRLIEDSNGGGVAEWQPGDGTRYLLVAKALTHPEALHLGSSGGAMMVSVGPGSTNFVTLVLFPGDVCHITYFHEKSLRMHFSEYTTKVLTAFVNTVFGDYEYGTVLVDEIVKDRRGK